MKNKLSIIIPTLRLYNFSKLLTNIELNSNIDTEIIVVTNEEIKNLYTGHTNTSLHFVIDDKQIGTTYAIGQGLNATTGNYILTLSDDCLIAPNAFEYMLNALEKHKNDLVIGNFNVYDRTGFLPKIGYYGRQFSPFPILSRKNLERLKTYYSTEYNAFYSDPDLGVRLVEMGGFIVNVPIALIYHPYNPDELHKNNKSKYFQRDEDIFVNKWKHLGEFKGCEKII